MREELLEQRAGLGFAQTADHLRRMMTGRLGKKARAMLDRAAFGIGRAEIEAADAGKGDGGGAHGAGFERHIEVAIAQPFAAELGAGGADGEQLGMRGRVAHGEGAVAGAGQHLAVGAHHHGADRHFAEVASAFGLLEGKVHGPHGLATRGLICKLWRHGRQNGG